MKPIGLAMMAGIVSGCTVKPVDTSARYSPSPVRSDAPTSGGTFAKGDPESRVRAVMGHPEATNEMAGGSLVWHYRFSSVRFENGRVAEWNDASRILKTRGPGGSGQEMASGGSSGPAGGNQISVPTGFTGATVINPPASGPDRAINPDQYYVGPYVKDDGTRVPGHLKTRANSTTRDNIRGR